MSGELPRIKQLPPEVYHKIKAGEVINYPKNVIKELLENSLDAGCTQITIDITKGGIQRVSLRDNGHGINEKDMAIVCGEHTTSKLETFEDLRDMTTYGFRGEALSSMTYVANVTIMSKTEDSITAYQGEYKNGKLVGNLRHIAGNVGTLIIVEGLFSSNQSRRNALKPYQEEQRIVQMLCPYALHNSGVGITLRNERHKISVKTQTGASLVDNIRKLYGENVSKNIMSTRFKSERYHYECVLYFTNPNWSAQGAKKRNKFLLFINDRLVVSRNLKKSVEGAFENILPKGTKPWVYCSLKLPRNTVDVNVSVTKEKVGFLNEEEIVSEIQQKVRDKLMNSNDSRVFQMKKTQRFLTNNPQRSLTPHPPPPAKRKNKRTSLQQKEIVRPTPQKGAMEPYLKRHKRKFVGTPNDPTPPPLKRLKVRHTPDNKSRNRLGSVLELEEKLGRKSDEKMNAVFRNNTYVGWVNEDISVIQHESQLFAIDVGTISSQFVYQMFLRRFGEFRKMKFNDPIDVKKMVQMAIEVADISKEDLERENLSQQFQNLKTGNLNKMVKRYFKMDVDENGMLWSLPEIIESYIPPLVRLPDFLLDFLRCVKVETSNNVSQIDSEKRCFYKAGKCFAEFYRLPRAHELMKEEGGKKSGAGTPKVDGEVVVGFSRDMLKYHTQHSVIARCRQYGLKSKKEWGKDGTVVAIANLKEIYKVFERC